MNRRVKLSDCRKLIGVLKSFNTIDPHTLYVRNPVFMLFRYQPFIKLSINFMISETKTFLKLYKILKEIYLKFRGSCF